MPRRLVRRAIGGACFVVTMLAGTAALAEDAKSATNADAKAVVPAGQEKPPLPVPGQPSPKVGDVSPVPASPAIGEKKVPPPPKAGDAKPVAPAVIPATPAAPKPAKTATPAAPAAPAAKDAAQAAPAEKPPLPAAKTPIPPASATPPAPTAKPETPATPASPAVKAATPAVPAAPAAKPATPAVPAVPAAKPATPAVPAVPAAKPVTPAAPAAPAAPATPAAPAKPQAQGASPIPPAAGTAAGPVAPATNSAEAEAAWKAYEKRWSETADYSAGFRQTIEVPDVGSRVESAGRFYFAKPGLVRWDYTEGPPQTVVGDGSTLWLYQPDLQQVYKIPYAKAFGRGGLVELLAGREGVAERYRASLVKPDATTVRIMLKSVAEGSGDLEVTLSSDTFDLKDVTVHDAAGSTTHMTFAEPRRNHGIDKGRFTFTPPPAVDVISESAGF